MSLHTVEIYHKMLRVIFWIVIFFNFPDSFLACLEVPRSVATTNVHMWQFTSSSEIFRKVLKCSRLTGDCLDCCVKASWELSCIFSASCVAHRWRWRRWGKDLISQLFLSPTSALPPPRTNYYCCSNIFFKLTHILIVEGWGLNRFFWYWSNCWHCLKVWGSGINHYSHRVHFNIGLSCYHQPILC